MPKAEWTVLIADDEPAARRGVRQMLSAHPEFTIARECRDGREVLAALDEMTPDVIFLDIRMPEVGGFDVIRRRTPARMPAVVFLTAYDRFAVQAFEAEAFDYLVKPVTRDRFAATMRRLVARLRGRVGDDGAPARDASIVVPTARGVLVIPVREIDWIEAADSYARIWVGARSYLLRESLAQLEKRTAGHGFTRAHRQALVRVGAVRALEDGNALLTTGASVPVSRRRRATFAAALRAWTGGTRRAVP